MKSMSIELICKRAARYLDLAPVHKCSDYVLFRVDSYLLSGNLKKCHFPSFTIQCTSSCSIELCVYRYELQ